MIARFFEMVLYILAAIGIIGIADVLFLRGQIGVKFSDWIRESQ